MFMLIADLLFLTWFSLLALRCGSDCQFKVQAAARVGRSGISDGCFTAALPPLKKALDVRPSCLAKEILF